MYKGLAQIGFNSILLCTTIMLLLLMLKYLCIKSSVKIKFKLRNTLELKIYLHKAFSNNNKLTNF